MVNSTWYVLFVFASDRVGSVVHMLLKERVRQKRIEIDKQFWCDTQSVYDAFVWVVERMALLVRQTL